MAFLEEKAIEIDDLGKALEEAHINLGDTEAAWEKAKDEALLDIVHEHTGRGERVPAEDIRLAMVRARCGFEVYADYRKAKRLCEGLEQHARKMETAISARQSTLKGMQEAERVPPFNAETGEIIGGRR